MATPKSKPARQRRPSMVPREVLQSIDRTERMVAFLMAGLGGAFSLFMLAVIVFVGKRSVTVTAKPIHGKCPNGYHLHAATNVCSQIQVTNIGMLWYEFALLAITSGALAFFAWRRRRTGLVFVSLFEGLALGMFSFGLPFVFLGVWLLWRAYRLQKYGVATFAGVSAIAREQSLARKEGREVPVPKPAVTTTASAPVTPPGPKPPAPPSKRYTPKKQTKKR